jgi:tRNA dimethylallyltransferase
MQAYRGLDIGTAKPTPDEREEVAHHLIDVVDPHEEWSVADFQLQLDHVRRAITGRGHRVVFVGGTGLHLRAAVDGLTLPGVWPDLRSELEERARTRGTRALYDELVSSDPQAAAKIEPDNTRRVVRALEVTLGSGRPFSSFGQGLDAYPRTEVVQIGLRWERAALERRIATRIDHMIRSGWCAEVERLLAAPRPLSRTASVAVGYRELAEHLRGERSLDEAVVAIILRTRQLAARQMRWFRRDPRLRWFDVVDDPVVEVLPELLELVNA